MNRIEKRFRQLAKEGRKALIVYLTAGYPDLEATADLVPAIAEAGADIVELGVPFSDPVADGVTIQRANAAALASGVSLPAIIECAARIRKRSEVPLALMGYYNPFLALGSGATVSGCLEAGIDALIIPDLPPGESGPLRVACRRAGLGLVFLLAPNSPPDRVRIVARLSRPFIYCVSVAGTTGARRAVPRDMIEKVSEIRRLTARPACLGFGISSPGQAALFARYFDGVIVGSALVRAIEKAGPARAREAACRLVGELSRAVNPG